MCKRAEVQESGTKQDYVFSLADLYVLSKMLLFIIIIIGERARLYQGCTNLSWCGICYSYTMGTRGISE